MIADNIKNAERYYSIHPNFRKAFEALIRIDSDTPDGKIEIDGNNVFINNASYNTKPVSECKFESHNKYLDIQFVLSGEENIDECDSESLELTENKLFESDVAFYEAPKTFHTLSLKSGDFAIFFPGEAHRPSSAPDNNPSMVKKAVAKILL